MDLLGPLPKNKGGKRFINVITDGFSNLILCAALKKTIAREFDKAFVDPRVYAYRLLHRSIETRSFDLVSTRHPRNTIIPEALTDNGLEGAPEDTDPGELKRNVLRRLDRSV